MGCWLKDWARMQTVITRRSVVVTAGWTAIFPADPDRFAVIIPSSYGMATLYSFSDGTPTNPLFMVPAQAQDRIWTEDDMGSLVTLPFWAQLQSGGQTVEAVSLAYNPGRRAAYVQWLNDQLSKLGALGLTP